MLQKKLSRILSTFTVILLIQSACSFFQPNNNGNQNNSVVSPTPNAELAVSEIQTLEPTLLLPENLQTITPENIQSLAQVESLGSELLHKIEVTSDNNYLIALTTDRLEIYNLEKSEMVNEISRPLGFTFAASFGFQVWLPDKVDWFNTDGTLYFSYPKKEGSLIGLGTDVFSIYAIYEERIDVIDPNSKQTTKTIQGDDYKEVLEQYNKRLESPLDFELFPNNTIAIAFKDRVDILDLKTSKPLLSISKGEYEMYFSPDGSYVIFKNQQNPDTFSLNIYNEPTLIPFTTVESGTLIFTTDSNYFTLVDGYDISVWETANGNLVNRISMETQGYTSCCQFVGNTIVYGVTSNTASKIYQFKKWDFLNNNLTPFFEGEDVKISPSGIWALETTPLKNSDGSTSGNALPLEVFKTSNPNMKTELPNSDHFERAYFSDDEKYVVIEIDNKVLLWELESASYDLEFSTISTDWKGKAKLLSSTKGILVAKIGINKVNQWQVFDGETNNLILEKKNTSYPIEKILVSPDGQSLITLDTNNNIAGWDLTTGKLIFQTYLEGYLLAFTPDSSGFITFDYTTYADNQGNDPVVFRHLSLVDGSVITNMKSVFSIFDEWSYIDFSNDNIFFAAENRNDGMIGVWNLRNGEMIYSLTSGNGIRYMDLSPNGKYLSYEESGTKVIDITSSKIVFEVDANDYSQISPNSNLIFIYYTDRVDIWNFLNNELLGSITYAQLKEDSNLSTNPILPQLTQEDIEWLRDHITGKHAFAEINAIDTNLSLYPSEDNFLMISDFSGRSVELAGHRGKISSYFFALGGRLIISHSKEDGTVRFWGIISP